MDRGIMFFEFGEHHKSLRIIRALFSLLGAVLLALGTLLLVFGLYALLAGKTGEPSPSAGPFAVRPVGVLPLGAGLGGIISLLWSFALLLSGLQFVALGALFRLFIHLEENTRASARSLDKIRIRLETRGEDVEPFLRS
jgi:hypothetical protein